MGQFISAWRCRRHQWVFFLFQKKKNTLCQWRHERSWHARPGFYKRSQYHNASCHFASSVVCGAQRHRHHLNLTKQSGSMAVCACMHRRKIRRWLGCRARSAASGQTDQTLSMADQWISAWQVYWDPSIAWETRIRHCCCHVGFILANHQSPKLATGNLWSEVSISVSCPWLAMLRIRL